MQEEGIIIEDITANSCVYDVSVNLLTIINI